MLIHDALGVLRLLPNCYVFFHIINYAVIFADAQLELVSKLIVGEEILTIVACVIICDSSGTETLAISC